MLQRLALLTIPLVFVPAFAAAQTCPNPGDVPITDRAAATAAGIPASATCWNPNDANVGMAVAQAKQDLMRMVCDSSIDIQHLDAKFAVCADKFMQQIRQTMPRTCVRSGFRDSQTQLKACLSICGQSSCPGKCAPPGHSYHQRGLAIDVSGITSNPQSWQIAASDGIVNPPGLHSSDPNHFQAANLNCAGMSVPAADQGDYYDDTIHFFQPSPFASPLSGGYMPPPPPPPMFPTNYPNTLSVPTSNSVPTNSVPNVTPGIGPPVETPTSNPSADQLSQLLNPTTNTNTSILDQVLGGIPHTSTTSPHATTTNIFNALPDTLSIQPTTTLIAQFGTSSTVSITGTSTFSLNPAMTDIVSVQPIQQSPATATNTSDLTPTPVQSVQTFAPAATDLNSNGSNAAFSSGFNGLLARLGTLLQSLLSLLRGRA